MKQNWLHKAPILALLIGLFNNCNLDPIAAPETFERVIETSDFTLNSVVDGVELNNGDVIVVGTAQKNGQGDLYIARIGLDGSVKDSKTFNAGGNEEIFAMCKDDEEELYVVGKDETSKKGIVYKISPKNSTFTQVSFKNDIDLLDCVTLKKVEFFNNLIYVISGTKNGAVGVCNATGFITLNKSMAAQVCLGKYGRVNALASAVGNNELVYAGEDGSKSLIVYPDCVAPKFSNANAGGFSNIWGLVAASDGVYIAGNRYLSGTKASVFVIKQTWANLKSGAGFTIAATVDKNQFDSTANRNSYQVFSMTARSNTLILATSYSNVGSTFQGTHLKNFDFTNIGTSPLIDKWILNPPLNLTASKVFNSNYQNHGGYIVLGQANSKAKVIKVNRIGKL